MKMIQKYQACEEIDYDSFGNDDIMGLIRRELAYFPDSCFSKLCIDWYNATYVALGEPVEVGCVEDIEPATQQQLVDSLFDILAKLGKNEGKKQVDSIAKELRGKLNRL